MRPDCCLCWQNGWTALIWGARNGKTDCVRLLVDAKAQLEAKTKVSARG